MPIRGTAGYILNIPKESDNLPYYTFYNSTLRYTIIICRNGSLVGVTILSGGLFYLEGKMIYNWNNLIDGVDYTNANAMKKMRPK